MTTEKHNTMIASLPIVLSGVILLVMAVIIFFDVRQSMMRKEDLPPSIDFTWTPSGRVSLKEMKGFLSMKDDYALDFKTYRMIIVELGKTVDLPIDGLIGKDYEQTISLSWLAENPKLIGKDKITLEFFIADDHGQKTTITRVIPLE